MVSPGAASLRRSPCADVIRVAAGPPPAAIPPSRARVCIDLYLTLNRVDQAIGVGLGFLRTHGIDWPLHPSDDEPRAEYERVGPRLASRTIEELADLHLRRTVQVRNGLKPARTSFAKIIGSSHAAKCPPVSGLLK
ncbi:hypothetical protein BX592_11853 [Paraburkholderia rhizosphaerae]|uniref:Uncharacterized protein n=1 Tax=Paraburkholderia rhizosphaerae TaxID=480658 RepID=A0A4R8LIS9_9BURK|nr:hypothetical protein BX592_11853 [Paraburkholderia rhizosphaerae]